MMRMTFVSIFLAIIISIQSALGQPFSYLNQNDQSFYDLKFIPNNQPSSLCGPSSYINLLMTENIISKKSDAINIIVKHSEIIKQKFSINVHNGLIESDLVKFINSVNEDLDLFNDYRIYGDAFESISLSNYEILSKLNSSKNQILLLKLEEIKQSSPFERRNRYGLEPIDENPPNVYFHFVHKKKNNQNEIVLIDSEDPSFEIIVKAKIEKNHQKQKDEVILIAQTPKSFHRFKFQAPYKIKLKSLIESN